jgi:3-deoxy-D-manno-octulosonic acid kinase
MSEKMALKSVIKISEGINNAQRYYILYDANRVDEPVVKLFDANYHIKRPLEQNNLVNTGVGRAPVIYFEYKKAKKMVAMVLKHYYRGGLIAKFVKDKYFMMANEKTRAFREWRLLDAMHKLQLPVPVPIAAKIEKKGFFYTADLITEEIKNAKTFADILQTEVLINKNIYLKVGETIALFHHHHVYHADLNARNILVANNKIYIIDFDNSAFKQDNSTWKKANLARLKRSLEKFKKNNGVFYYNETHWQQLLQAYKDKMKLLVY